MDPADTFDPQRFVDAQQGVFETALEELRQGNKRTHWMWFVFPQLSALGRSPNARYYGLHSVDQARAYLAHPLLGSHLRQSVEALLPWAGKRSAEAILGPVDAMKLKSSLTLFEAASAEPNFTRALDLLFDGERDSLTLDLLPA
jgi:uncharacterized protein (DUF1810 family)